MRLIPASMVHVDALMSWVPDAGSLRMWGGERFRYPFTRESFLEDIHWGTMATFVLVDEREQVLAFGQFYEKLGRGHLARLIVAPASRGQGCGSELVRQLIAEAERQLSCTEWSLYVHESNEKALRCYRGLGFTEAEYPKQDPYYPSHMFMIKAK